MGVFVGVICAITILKRTPVDRKKFTDDSEEAWNEMMSINVGWLQFVILNKPLVITRRREKNNLFKADEICKEYNTNKNFGRKARKKKTTKKI
jgi:hypothetical protein